jgi:hypothetical protein
MSKNGQWRAMDTGGLFHPHKLAYKYVRGDTTHPAAVNGFWTVREGTSTPYNDRMTHWDSVLKRKGSS